MPVLACGIGPLCCSVVCGLGVFRFSMRRVIYKIKYKRSGSERLSAVVRFKCESHVTWEPSSVISV